MCGIVAAIAGRDVIPILMEGLKRLEYRGYDSAGIAVLEDSGIMKRVRTVGKVRMLAEAIAASPTSGRLGVAHTRLDQAHPAAAHHREPGMPTIARDRHSGLLGRLDRIEPLVIG